jgi:hypothetical protein
MNFFIFIIKIFLSKNTLKKLYIHIFTKNIYLIRNELRVE